MRKEKRYKEQLTNPYDTEYGYEGKPVCGKCGQRKVKGQCPKCNKKRYG